MSQEVANVTGPAFEDRRRRTRGIADPAERERIHHEIFDRLSIPGATIGQVADHVDHIRKVAGVGHVGLGGDYDGNTLWPEGLENVSRYPYLFSELIRRGWSDSDLRNLAGANLLRVMRSVETTAKRLATSRQASTATIEKLDGAPPGR